MTARMIMKLRVAEAHYTTADVLHLTFRHPLRPELPGWTAGAHVDVRLPDGRVRQYSLCGDPQDRTKYEIAVKLEKSGRGGSKWVHENLKEGAIAHVSVPRNNLPISDGAFVSPIRDEAEYIRAFWDASIGDVAGRSICIDITGFIRP